MHSVLMECEMYYSGGSGSAGFGKVCEIHGAGLADRGIRIECTGVEVQDEVMSVLAGEGAGRDRPDDLGEGFAAEIGSNLERSEVQRGAVSGSRGGGSGDG